MVSTQHVPFRAQPSRTFLRFTPRGFHAKQSHFLRAAICIAGCALAYRKAGWCTAASTTSFGTDPDFTCAVFRYYVLLLGGMLTGWNLEPYGLYLLSVIHARLTPGDRRIGIVLSLIATCASISSFLISVGRHQFGAWDYNILIDVGWRQLLGQRPFVDFITPTPPLFNLTAALAFRLFGVSWNASLYFSAIFSSVTLVWAFLLLRRLGMRSVAALGTSSLIQAAAMLTCCFWWYNNTTLVLASIFYLSTLLVARSPVSRFGQSSFVLLLGFLLLGKPNIAGLTVAGCVALLLGCSQHRRRILLLTAGGFALSGFLLSLGHVSLPALMDTYRGIAKERGGLSTFGYEQMSTGEQRMTWIWMPLLCLPLLSIWRPLNEALRLAHWRQAVFWCFFPLSALVAVYGIAGNGELRDVECTLILAALGVLAFAFKLANPRVTVALFCGMLAADTYTGIARLRVYTIAPHVFFEWQNNDGRPPSSFLRNLRVSRSLISVNQQLTQAVRSNPGSVFLGPRLEFEYAVQNLPSPTHLPLFFQPGTAFDRARTSTLVNVWNAHAFHTLIFLKNDYTFYPDSILNMIQTEYARDDHYPQLTIYHRRPGL